MLHGWPGPSAAGHEGRFGTRRPRHDVRSACRPARHHRPARHPQPVQPAHDDFLRSASAVVTVSIYGVDGRLVRRLWKGDVVGGSWHHEWDGRDDAGRDVAAGIYLVRARAGDSFTGGRVALVR
ncbi:MAG: hypothetical protein IPH86_15890 [bacterium]|nr:hypothetical protein [bacterium]